MVDRVSAQVRSKIMSSVKSKDTKPEISLRRELFKRGFRYSLKHHFKGINIKPDIVMVSRKTCIFVDGCFWHKCPECYEKKEPKSNRGYWLPKIQRNVERDNEQNMLLKKLGWDVIRIWEHEIKTDVEKVCRKIESRLYR